MVLVVLQAACVAPPGQAPVEVIDLEAPSEGALSMPERRIESGGGNAVDQLLAQAGSAIDRQQYDRGAALVERAMRINPQDPRAYFALAQVNFYQQRQAHAESLLQKARALAVNDPRLLRSIEAFGQRIAATAKLR
ncbi:MAG: tetratricopeptide repeat protein [Pseudomonadales bacterium]